MTSAFHLYYFIDSRASMVVHIVSLHLASPSPPPSSSSQFQPQGSYFEKWQSPKQILSHCCCWLIQLFGRVANGHNVHEWKVQLLMIHSSSCGGSSPTEAAAQPGRFSAHRGSSLKQTTCYRWCWAGWIWSWWQENLTHYHPVIEFSEWMLNFL